MSSIKFISCNIEGRRHLESRILPLLKKERPDVFCAQEIFAADLPVVAQSLRSDYFFQPMADLRGKHSRLAGAGQWGLAIFASNFIAKKFHYYFGGKNPLPEFYTNKNPNIFARVLLSAKIKKDQQIFTIANTHFIWSGEGRVSALQKQVYLKLKAILAQYPNIILCGDMNTPRGNFIFDDLAKKYTDNIPASIKTTIDKNLHHSGKDIQLVVDVLFTSSVYRASQVRVLSNTSDHMAVVAQIQRRER